MELERRLLQKLVAHKDEPKTILALFREAGLDEARLSQVNSEADPVTPYSRVVLASVPECEVMLARWAPDRVCAPHDHGASAGWVFYLEGEFEEVSYRWLDGMLVLHAIQVHPSGAHTRVTTKEIHSCICKGQGLSLHVYFPRIERMRVYDLEKRRTIVVTDDCGAWIPEDGSKQRVEEMAWT